MTFSFIDVKVPGVASEKKEAQDIEEKLSGDQHKLDHDKDGDIDGKDFAMMRMKKKKKKMDSPTKDEPEGENGDTAEMNPKIKDKEKKMEKKESRIREALLSVLENKRVPADAPKETMDDKYKGAGAKKMKDDIKKGAKIDDTVKKGHEDASAAGGRGPSAKGRNSGDNVRSGDQKIKPSGTPMKDPSSPNQKMESLVQAYKSMNSI